jgi:hypothetical protein
VSTAGLNYLKITAVEQTATFVKVSNIKFPQQQFNN